MTAVKVVKLKDRFDIFEPNGYLTLIPHNRTEIIIFFFNQLGLCH